MRGKTASATLAIGVSHNGMGFPQDGIYHFILLMPSLARMNAVWMAVTWFVSWTPLLANWVGPIGWRMGNILAACIWLGIYFGKRMKSTQKMAENAPAAALNQQISAELPTID